MENSRIRAANLNLLRWRTGGHKPLTKALSAISNWTYISKMICLEREISDFMAREIERELKLPKGWMDRENNAILNMRDVDYTLYKKLSTLPDERKEGLLAFLSGN
jgi:hypothetical protein